jgi:tRNA uridine 5-carboxymethylaminomethyl modification enzyme
LHLRIDNADRRLTPHGRKVGLISDEAWSNFEAKQRRLENIKRLLEQTRLTPERLENLGQRHATPGSDEPAVAEATGIAGQLSAAIGQTCAQLLKRPEIVIEQMAAILRELNPEFFARQGIPENSQAGALPSEIRNELKSVETEIKYEGYLLQQQRAMDRMKKSEQRDIPHWFDYGSVSGLSHEMQEKLSRVQPRTLGHASRIPGVTPAAVSLVNVFIEIQAKRRDQASLL